MQGDIELLAAYRAGSTAAFSMLVSRHINWVYAAALRRVGDAHLAEDVTQTVFIALTRETKLREGGSMPGWLFQTVRYASAKAIRAKVRRQQHESEAALRRPVSGLADDPWETISPLLDQAVDRLGSRDRQAILLRFYQQWSFAQVGEAMALTEEGARKRVARAIAKLQKYFGVQTLSVTGLTEIMLAKMTQTAPASLVTNILARSTAVGVEQPHPPWFTIRWRLAVIAAILIIAFGLWFARGRKTLPFVPPLALVAKHPQVATAPASQPAGITLTQLLDGIKKSETQFQNLYIKNFETTVSRLPKGQTQWVLTPRRTAGSAWYDADPNGKARLYVSDEAIPVEQAPGDHGPEKYLHSSRDVSWDGTQGRELMLGMGSSADRLRRRRQAWTTTTIPFTLESYSHRLTGAGYTLQYSVTDSGGWDVTAPNTLSNQLAGVTADRVELVPETVNGFDTIRFSIRHHEGTVFWFSPSRGYALVKTETTMTMPKFRHHSGWEVQTLKEISPGVWFPLKASWSGDDFEKPGGKERLDYQAEDAVANDPHLGPDIFNAEIPVGWLVKDGANPTSGTHMVGNDGTPIEIQKGDRVPNVKPGTAQRPDGGN
jgi:RNA polymerase sigma factor (sigma-70 family)